MRREEVGPGTASGHSWAHSSTVNLAGCILHGVIILRESPPGVPKG